GYEGQPITLGTLFALAKSYVWEEPPPDEIAELNRRYFVIGNIGGKCLVGEIVTDELGLECLSLQSTHDFKSRYANRKFRFRDGHGNEKWKPLGAAWLEHAKRRQYEGVDLVPDEPKELKSGKLNLWRGFGVTSKKGDWGLMKRHIVDVLANGDVKAAT